MNLLPVTGPPVERAEPCRQSHGLAPSLDQFLWTNPFEASGLEVAHVTEPYEFYPFED